MVITFFRLTQTKYQHELIDNLPQILEMNSVDVILVPRVNLVDGLTDGTLKWNWKVDDKGRVNWPDPQWKFIRNPNPFVG